MPAYERSAVMARGYPGFADGRSRTEFEGVKKNQKKLTARFSGQKIDRLLCLAHERFW